MEIRAVRVEKPEEVNIILGQTHFIKTAEDIFEAVRCAVPSAKFGVAFCEASGPCLVRAEGNDPELKELAARNAFSIGAGHLFIVLLKEAYPINVLRAIREVPEVCNILCATANPLEVLVVDHGQGRGVVGVVDGHRAKGIETEGDVGERRALLRKIGYKLG
jgi:hypothetical protein